MDLSLSLSPPLPIQKKRRRHSSSSSSSSNNPPFPPSQPPEDGVDRLTALPDALLLHILSFLPVSDAIRTGTLSSQWKDLWKTRHPHRHLTKIHLNLVPGCRPTPHLRHLSKQLLEPGKLFLSFHLSFSPKPHHLQLLHTVLHNVAACGVEDLSLDLRSTSSTFCKPTFNFSISANLSSLVRLSLSGFHLSRLPSYFNNFLNLEYLSFCRMNISDTIFRMIVASCPLLRTLDVRKCPDLKKVVAVGQKIVNVTVVDCPKVIQIVVRAELLNKFHFKGRFARDYRFQGAENLKDVYICSDGVESGFPMSNWVAEVHGLRHVTVLTICSFSLQYMMAADTGVLAQFQTLDCLRELQLLMFSMTEENLTDIYKFFRLCQCPNLERLFIELPANMHDPYMEKFMEVATEEPPPMSAFANLKTIKINGFKGHRYEMSLVRFFWLNSSNLESLTVVCPQEREEEECSRRGWDNIHCYTLQFLRENDKIVVIEDDDRRVRPTHEAYCKV